MCKLLQVLLSSEKFSVVCMVSIAWSTGVLFCFSGQLAGYGMDVIGLNSFYWVNFTVVSWMLDQLGSSCSQCVDISWEVQ